MDLDIEGVPAGLAVVVGGTLIGAAVLASSIPALSFNAAVGLSVVAQFVGVGGSVGALALLRSRLRPTGFSKWGLLGLASGIYFGFWFGVPGTVLLLMMGPAGCLADPTATLMFGAVGPGVWFVTAALALYRTLSGDVVEAL